MHSLFISLYSMEAKNSCKWNSFSQPVTSSEYEGGLFLYSQSLLMSLLYFFILSIYKALGSLPWLVIFLTWRYTLWMMQTDASQSFQSSRYTMSVWLKLTEQQVLLLTLLFSTGIAPSFIIHADITVYWVLITATWSQTRDWLMLPTGSLTGLSTGSTSTAAFYTSGSITTCLGWTMINILLSYMKSVKFPPLSTGV